jgi:dTDP-4-dehydrorhamnose reductase
MRVVITGAQGQLGGSLRAAKVPRRAVLRNFCEARQLGIDLRPWEEALSAYYEERRSA